MTRLRRVLLFLRDSTQGPLLGVVCVTGLLVLVVSFLLKPITRAVPSPDPSEDEYSTLTTRIGALEIEELTGRGKDANFDSTGIEKQLAPLRTRLAELQPHHDQEVEKIRRENEAESARQKQKMDQQQQEKDQQQIRAAEIQMLEFQKRCEDVRSKRIVDLTVNDVELLKQCGTPVPHLPLQ